MKKERTSQSFDAKKNTHPSSFISPPSTPKRRFGQNFLTDANVVRRIINEVQPKTDETIIEIGPGRGALTGKLIESDARVVAIEFDRDLVAELDDQFAGAGKLKIIQADALTINFCEAI